MRSEKFCSFIKFDGSRCSCYKVKNMEYCVFHNNMEIHEQTHIDIDDKSVNNEVELRVNKLEQELHELKKILQKNISSHEEYVSATKDELKQLKQTVSTYETKLKKQNIYMNTVHFFIMIAFLSIIAYLNQLQLTDAMKCVLAYVKVYKSVIQHFTIKYFKMLKTRVLMAYYKMKIMSFDDFRNTCQKIDINRTRY